MKSIIAVATAFILVAGSFSSLHADAGYSQNPLAQWWMRQQFEGRMEIDIDPSSGKNDTLGLLFGAGYVFTENIVGGIYASWHGSDRELPSKMENIFGFGGYADYIFNPRGLVRPFLGGQIGLYDTSGPGYGSFAHFAAVAGVRLAMTERVDISVSMAGNLTNKELYNWSDSSRSGDKTDLTLNIGLRLML